MVEENLKFNCCNRFFNSNIELADHKLTMGHMKVIFDSLNVGAPEILFNALALVVIRSNLHR